MIKLESERGVYYEYDPSIPPVREDAWGEYHIGNCYLKKGSIFQKKVSVCIISHSKSYYVHPILKLLKNIPPIDFTQTPFIPIIDNISFGNECYLIEDFHNSVSLYELMQGQTSGVDGKTFEYATKMYDMYQNNRIDFAKIVVKEILKGIKFIHDHAVCIRYIEPPECIFFSADGKINIRMINSLFYDCSLHKQFGGAITYATASNLIPFEYISPEEMIKEERGYTHNMAEIYSVGILMFCIITGHLPFKGVSLKDCHHVHSSRFDALWNDDDGDLLSNLKSRVNHNQLMLDEIKDIQLKKVIEKATKKVPWERYQSTTEFTNALDGNEGAECYNTVEQRSLWHMSFFATVLKWLILLLLIFFIAVFFCLKVAAQNTMRINYNDGSKYEIPIERIDSITFVEKETDLHEYSFIGEWFWGSKEKGYYELLTFNQDKTFTCYDFFLEYGFDTWTYGTYGAWGTLLNLWSNGYGYRRIYRWYVTALTENALDVMTQTGAFIYFRVQPTILHLKVGGEPIKCEDGASYLFADDVKASIRNNQLYGIAPGITYIQIYISSNDCILAYKVIVE